MNLTTSVISSHFKQKIEVKQESNLKIKVRLEYCNCTHDRFKEGEI
jgi:hypothetical protein